MSRGALFVAPAHLQLSPVLLNGQSFRWKQWRTPHSFVGAAHGRLWMLTRVDSRIEWNVIARHKATKNEDDETVLRDYLQLRVAMDDLYINWEKEAPMKTLLANDSTKGIRILRQSPLECTLAFICSANNNIKRITRMVNRIAEIYGQQFNHVHDQSTFQEISEDSPELIHDFPSLEELNVDGMEEKLRMEGFGYRARYIQETVKSLQSRGGIRVLEELRSKTQQEARNALLSLTGIGPKVADCILLMSLDQHSVVPLDTHMWKVTRTFFLPSLPLQPSTNLHPSIREMYEKRLGEYAGWAQAVLFNVQLEKSREGKKEKGSEGRVDEVDGGKGGNSKSKGGNSKTKARVLGKRRNS